MVIIYVGGTHAFNSLKQIVLQQERSALEGHCTSTLPPKVTVNRHLRRFG